MVVLRISREGGSPSEISVGEGNNYVTVLHVKQRIEEVYSVDVERQVLKYNGRVLRDARGLEYYSIQDGSHLHVYVDTTHTHLIFCRFLEEPQSYSQIVSKMNTLRELKEIAAQFWGVTYNRVRLYFDGAEMVEEDDLLREFGMYNMVDVTVRIV